MKVQCFSKPSVSNIQPAPLHIGYYEDFAQAMGQLEGIQGDLRTLARESAAHNAELQDAGGPLLQCLDELAECRTLQERIGQAETALGQCEFALEVAAAANENVEAGALYSALRCIESLEEHLTTLPSATLRSHLRAALAPGHEAVAQAADRRAT